MLLVLVLVGRLEVRSGGMRDGTRVLRRVVTQCDARTSKYESIGAQVGVRRKPRYATSLTTATFMRPLLELRRWRGAAAVGAREGWLRLAERAVQDTE